MNGYKVIGQNPLIDGTTDVLFNRTIQPPDLLIDLSIQPFTRNGRALRK